MTDFYPAVVIAVFLAGSCAGRLLHHCTLVFPRHLSLTDQMRALWRERVCHSCGKPVSAIQHLPLVAWWVAGRCRSCGRRMDHRRPVVELITGLMLALLYWLEIPAFTEAAVAVSALSSPEGPPGPAVVDSLWSPLVWLHLRYLLHAAMLCGLIIATVIDFELRIIPDGCTVPVMLFAVLFAFATGQVHIVPLWFQDVSTSNVLRSAFPDLLQPLIFEWNAVGFSRLYPHWHGLLVSVAGLVAGAASIWSVRVIGFWALKQEAMGDGDVVLMAMIGAVIGWQPVLIVFFVAPLPAIFAAVGMWVIRRDRYIPYGPWLSAATFLVLIAWRPIWPYAKRFFDMGPALFAMAVFLLGALAATLYLMQILKRVLRIAAPKSAAVDEWSSADHLGYYGSKRLDERTGQWPRPRWPGCRSGRGLLHEYCWRGM